MRADAGAVASRDTQTTSTPASGTTTTETTSSADEEGAGESVYTTLMIAGQEIQVRVPEAEGRTSQVDVPLDQRPVEGLHLTGATLNMDAEGTVVGGTVRGRLKLAGFFDGTEVSMGILPGGQVAPGIRDVPVKVGPATGTMDLMLDEGGLSGSGEIQAHSLGLPAWMGIEGGAMKVAIKDACVRHRAPPGPADTPGRGDRAGQAHRDTMTTKVTFVVTPGLEPVPRFASTRRPFGHRHAGSGRHQPRRHAQSLGRHDGGQRGARHGVCAVRQPRSLRTPGLRGGAGRHGRHLRCCDRRPDTADQPDPGWHHAVGRDGRRQHLVIHRRRQHGLPSRATGPDAFLLRGKGKVTIANWVTGDMD